jgi:UDPglucose 6-dehydrogenase
MGLDPRIGDQFLSAGLGFGGLLPKDLQALVHLAGTVGVDFEILKAAERVNKQRIDRFLEKVHQALWVVKGTCVAIPRLRIDFRGATRD